MVRTIICAAKRDNNTCSSFVLLSSTITNHYRDRHVVWPIIETTNPSSNGNPRTAHSLQSLEACETLMLSCGNALSHSHELWNRQTREQWVIPPQLNHQKYTCPPRARGDGGEKIRQSVQLHKSDTHHQIMSILKNQHANILLVDITTIQLNGRPIVSIQNNTIFSNCFSFLIKLTICSLEFRNNQ